MQHVFVLPMQVCQTPLFLLTQQNLNLPWSYLIWLLILFKTAGISIPGLDNQWWSDNTLLAADLGVLSHFYADDFQLYNSECPSTTDRSHERMVLTIEGLSTWMASNQLSLNPTKTELLGCATICQCSRLTSPLCSSRTHSCRQWCPSVTQESYWNPTCP